MKNFIRSKSLLLLIFLTGFTYSTFATETLTPVHIQSDNESSGLAKVGDNITLTFTSSSEISGVVVTIIGHNITGGNLTNVGNEWTANYVMVNGDTEGFVAFTVDYTEKIVQVSNTTDGSSVIFDKTGPIAPTITGISAGSYNTNKTFTISGEAGATIEYSTNNGGLWTAYSGAVTLSAAGTYNVLARQTDQAGNGPTISSVITLTIDKTTPTATSILRQNPSGSITNATSVIYRIYFAENVNGVDISDFSLSVTGTVTGSITSVSASNGINMDITVNSINGNGTLRLDLNAYGTGITDDAGNAISSGSGFTSGETFTFDYIAPTVTITSIATDPTSTSPIPLTITFSESVNGFVIDDIIVANGAKSDFSGSGTTYTVNITPTTIGTVTINIAAGVATDAAGNGNRLATQLARSYTTSAIAPTATTDAAGSITGTGATLNGTINANNTSTTVTFEYGLTTSYGTSVDATPKTVSGTTDTPVSYALSGLASNIMYHFKVVGLNGAGTTNGLDQTFTTLQTPVVTVDGTIHPFTYCEGSNSEVQSFTVSGSNLAADIIITPPSGFEVSTSSGSGFGGSLTLTNTDKTISSTTVYVRVGISAKGTFTGNITVTSTDAATQNVSVSRYIYSGAFYTSGKTFTIQLGCSSGVTVASTGTTYTFTLEAGNSWQGTAVGASVYTTTLTVSDLSLYNTFEIIDGAPNVRTNPSVSFAAGTYTFDDNLNILLDNNLAREVEFKGKVSFSGSNSISINTSSAIRFLFDSGLSTVDGNITLQANQRAVSTTLAYPGIEMDNSTVQATGTGIVTLKGKAGRGGLYGVRAMNGSLISGGTSGLLTVEGVGDDASDTDCFGLLLDGGQRIILSTITSNGADVLVTGTGSGGQTGHGIVVRSGGIITSGGNASVTVNGYGAANNTNGNYGVLVRNGNTNLSAITSGGSGKVKVTGTGGLSSTSVSQSGVGLSILSVITSGPGGSVEVTGYGGNNSSGNMDYGIYIKDATITCGTGIGTVTVSGTGGGKGMSSNNYGLILDGNGIITAGGSGEVNIVGSGGCTAANSSGSNNCGIYTVNSGNKITSNGGNVTVSGNGGVSSGRGNSGILMTSTDEISAGGSGNVTVTGIGGSANVSSGHSNYGIGLQKSSISSTRGNVVVNGTGGGGTGSVASASSNNNGIDLSSGAMITAGESGTVSVTGKGGNNSAGNTGGSNSGIFMANYPTQITSSGGNVQVTGTGGGDGGSSVDNYGVAVNSVAKITSSLQASTVTVTGTGGNSSGGANHGIFVSGSQSTQYSTITSGGGDVFVTGTEGGTATTSFALCTASSGIITTATNGGNLTLTGNSMNFSSSTISAHATKSLNLVQRTNGVPFDLGTTTGDNTADDKIVRLSATEFGYLSGGTINIGNSNTGTITFSNGVSTTSNLNLATPSDKGVSPAASPTDLSITGKTLSFTSGTPLNILINGTTLNSGYSQLKGLGTGGTVNLSGASLSLSGTYKPLAGDVFTIVSATSVTGTFNSLPDRSIITFNTIPLVIRYSGTDVKLYYYTSPVLTTSDAASVTNLSATLGGSIASSGGGTVSRGVVYSTTDETPTIGETGVIQDANGTGTGSFSETISALSPVTTYYYQAYADNGALITYGGVKSFSTTASTIAVPTPSSLSGFIAATCTPSSSQTFVVSATGLTADLVISAPAGWEVRENGTGTFGSSVAFSPAQVAGEEKTIEVRLNSSASPAALSGNITCSSEGATSQTIAVSGTSAKGYYYASEKKFTVVLGCAADISVASTGSAYTFTLGSGSWQGSANGTSVSSTLLTVSDLSKYDTFEILGGGSNTLNNSPATVTFATGTYTFDHNLIIILDNLAKEVLFNGNVSFSGSNSISINTSSVIRFLSGSGLSTVNGNLTLIANQQAVSTTRIYPGIELVNSTIQSTGTGIVTLKGRAGYGGSYGIRASEGSRIIGGTAGLLTVEGKGEESASSNHFGLWLDGGTTSIPSTITSNGADVLVTGTGGISYNQSGGYGVFVQSGSQITSGGNGTVTVNGYGSNCSLGNNYGVYLSGGISPNFSTITSGGNGTVTVNGRGGSAPEAGGSPGVCINGVITSGSGGSVVVTGYGALLTTGLGGYGVLIYSGTISCGPGNGTVSVTGTGGGSGISRLNKGIYLAGNALITAGGAGDINLTGYGGNATGNSNGEVNTGIHMDESTPANKIISNGGNINLYGTGGGTSSSGNAGIDMNNGNEITATGNGTITMTGIGGSPAGSAGDNNSGLIIGMDGKITTSNGDIILNGTGGGGSGSVASSGKYNYGVQLGSLISAGGNGIVNVTGIGGNNSAAGTGGFNYGIYTLYLQATSFNGSVVVTGT